MENNSLPQPQQTFPQNSYRSKQTILLFVSIVLLLFLLVTSSIWFYSYRADKQEATYALGQQLADYEKKNFILPYDPTKPYVTSTVTYQQITGEITGFNTETSVLTLKKGDDIFSVVLPLGPNSNYTLPAFADLSGLHSFTVGDEVTILGKVETSGTFIIAGFTITKK